MRQKRLAVFVQTIEKKEPVAVKAVFRKDAAVTTSASGQMTLFMTEADGRLLGMAVAFSKEKIAFAKWAMIYPNTILQVKSVIF